MQAEVFMPKFGLTMREGTIAGWHKGEGDVVTKGEPLLEVTTEKINNEIEAPVSGILEKIIAQEGDTMPVGAVIALIQAADNTEQTVQSDSPAKIEDKVVEREIVLTGVRKVIAERMAESLQKAPQATVTTRMDMAALIAYKDSLALSGQKVTYTDMLVKVVAIALGENPVLNASLQDGKILIYKSINIGVAVATEDSLFVPVVKNAREKTVAEVSKEIKELTQKARAGKLSQQEISGGTFTLSNMGMYDVEVMTPIINLPEAAILSIGAIRNEVLADQDKAIRITPRATFSLTIDHAATDGAPAARFLDSVRKIITHPQSYLAE